LELREKRKNKLFQKLEKLYISWKM